MGDAPSQSMEKFIVRLPEGMRDQIKAAADANKRSMNAEIIHAIECHLEDTRRRATIEGIKASMKGPTGRYFTAQDIIDKILTVVEEFQSSTVSPDLGDKSSSPLIDGRLGNEGGDTE